MWSQIFADFHIHIGRSERGEPVKITAARNLTFANIIVEAGQRKGIEMVGIVDCASPSVLQDIKLLLAQGTLIELPAGGYRYLDQVTVLLGAEVETKERQGQTHCLCFFPTIEKMELFSQLMAEKMTNVNLSSQQCGLSMQELLKVVLSLQGILIPAHIFTPYKSLYGRCASSMSEILDDASCDQIKAVELGLSSDSYYADFLPELAPMTFLTNSDAHSLGKIGREYNLLQLAEANFQEFQWALERKKGRQVVKNFGLDPKLGKYHRTYCESCGTKATESPPVFICPQCGEQDRITLGVLDRLYQIRTSIESISPDHRPPYIYQVPLAFLPKVGPKTLAKLLDKFGTEMEVLHQIPIEELAQFNKQIAKYIRLARQGELNVIAGGGGIYGKVSVD